MKKRRYSVTERDPTTLAGERSSHQCHGRGYTNRNHVLQTRQSTSGHHQKKKSRLPVHHRRGIIALLALSVLTCMILFSFLASRSSSAVGLSAQAQSQPTLAFPSISDHPAPPVYATAAYLLDADTAET